MSDRQRWEWYAYDYAFRRLATQSRDDRLPTDPEKKWFNEDLVALAEVAFAREMGIRAPDLLDDMMAKYRRKKPSAEDIAYVEECCRKIRANLDKFVNQIERIRP